MGKINKQIRLKDWDYRNEASYFVTICTKARQKYFGNIHEGKISLNRIGEIALSCWNEIPNHFPFIVSEEFIIMPNHIHGILKIKKNKPKFEMGNENSCQNKEEINNHRMSDISPKSGSLSVILRSYKGAVTKHVRFYTADFGWQDRFYDHIIRNEKEYQKIKNYIRNNPKNWVEDKFYS